MAGSGVNMATTKDGGSYNKLQRPENYLISSTAPTPPPKALLPEVLASTHTNKRKREDGGSQRNQRTRLEREPVEMLKSRPGSTSKERSRGLECGMRSILPGLDDEGQSSDEGVREALAYLRNVRSEASAIPQLLVGSIASSDLELGPDNNVLFREGTFIAVDNHHFVRSSNQDYGEESVAVDPEDRLYQLLLKRFHRLRNTLANIAEQKDSHGNPSTLADSGKTCLQKKGGSNWSISIGQEPPTADQVVQLGSAIIYDCLQHCANTLDHATSLSPQTSSWIWSLLASIGDVGTLDNEKISRVRDLALKAGFMRNRLLKTNVGDDTSKTGGGATYRQGAHAKTSYNVEDSACEEGFTRDVGYTRKIDSTLEDTKTLQDRSLLSTHGKVDEPGALLGIGMVQHNSQCASTSLTSESESDAAMSVSGDEEESYIVEASDPEQARAQLLSQLGDRLVHAQPPPSANHSEIVQKHQYSDDSEQDMKMPLPAQKSRRSRTQADENHIGSEGAMEKKAGGPTGSGVDSNTQVTIDMILTVAAECFGQRDLLKYRKRW